MNVLNLNTEHCPIEKGGGVTARCRPRGAKPGWRWPSHSIEQDWLAAGLNLIRSVTTVAIYAGKHV